MFRIILIPIDHLPAPMAGEAARSYPVVKYGAVNKNASATHSERMIGHFSLPIPFLVDKFNRSICSTATFHALIMQIAKTVLRVWAVAPWNFALLLVNVVANIAIMLLAPMMHLAQAANVIWFVATLNRAAVKSLLVVRSVGTSNTAKLRHIIVVGADLNGLAAPFAYDSHQFFVASYIGHRVLLRFHYTTGVTKKPEFYGSTYCVQCRMHRPVGEAGEFVWEDGSKVGT